MDTINTRIEKLLENNPNICNNCLGRKVSDIVEGQDNPTRGQIIRNQLNLKEAEDCFICNNTFKYLDADKILKKVNKKIERLNLEFNTFIVGTKLDKKILDLDKQINEDLDLNVELIKKELNRIIGKTIEENLNKEVEFNNPDVVIMVDLRKIPDETIVKIQINPLYIEGRYNKFSRGIPQTKWPCTKCKGRGCDKCNGTGKQYSESVEELISEHVLIETEGYDAKFHGAGREDIDVRMLGTGRPFVLEIKEPKKRNIDLKLIEDKINKINEGKTKYTNLKFTKRNRKAEIKQSSPDTYKVYKAQVECEKPINKEKLEELKQLHIIEQRTPTRVAHRRADKIRKKEVKELELEYVDSYNFNMIIKTEGGLYIKELISGDDNRSKPSVSDILENKSICKYLDVIEVGIK